MTPAGIVVLAIFGCIAMFFLSVIVMCISEWAHARAVRRAREKAELEAAELANRHVFRFDGSHAGGVNMASYRSPTCGDTVRIENCTFSNDRRRASDDSGDGFLMGMVAGEILESESHHAGAPPSDDIISPGAGSFGGAGADSSWSDSSPDSGGGGAGSDSSSDSSGGGGGSD